MRIASWLAEELETVTPRYDSAAREAPRANKTIEDVEARAVRAPEINTRYGRTHGLTMRDRVEAILRERGTIAQRDIFARLCAANPDARPQAIRGSLTKVMEQLEEQGRVRRSDPPKGTSPQIVWWEVVS